MSTTYEAVPMREGRDGVWQDSYSFTLQADSAEAATEEIQINYQEWIRERPANVVKLIERVFVHDVAARGVVTTIREA